MIRNFTLLAVFLVSNLAFAGGNVEHNENKFEVQFVTNKKRLPDQPYQQKLRETPSWTNFMAASGGSWQVIFNEENGKPHRAYGAPIQVSGNTPDAKAKSFINTWLPEFKIPVSDLVLQGAPKADYFQYVNYYQTHKGMKVLFSRMYVKMTPEGGVVCFGADVYDNITLSNTPTLSRDAAAIMAASGITETIVSSEVAPDLCVFPMPGFHSYEFLYVYEVNVKSKDASGIPSDFYVIVDAKTGRVMYRHNKVMHFGPPTANVDVNVTGTVYPTHIYNPSSTVPLTTMRVDYGGTNYTDMSGYIGYANPGTATFYLEGSWCKVLTNNVTPSFSGSLVTGTNNISFNINANIRELSGYYHVNIVHDYMKSWFPTFPSMDNALPTNIDLTSGNCNAFYNGTSINFYALANGCNNLAQCGDVVYHEYGHGISDKFYQWQGGSFDNGAMGEGYSDIWGCSITGSPLLGVGFYTTNQNPIRQYNSTPMRYPENIVGEVHADGEIIAGAWWDVGQLLSINYMNKLFTDTHWALVTGPDGTEGQVFYDILVEALQADDVPANGGDNNICNGTPNGTQITQGFSNHGITLITNVNLSHTPVLAAAALNPIPVNVTLSNFNYICGTAGAVLYWRTDDVSPWTSIAMTGTPPNLTASIPSQPAGTIVRYYIGVSDNISTIANIQPRSADNSTNPNIPYYILVNFQRFVFDDFETFDPLNPTWVVGSTGDNATTGVWEFANPPSASYLLWPDPSTIVQPGVQHTSGGSKCFVTENTSSPTAGAGAEDVDGGFTTLFSPVFNLTSYTDPVISYWRWFSNDQGATPLTDYWQVYISNDNGASWDTVEYISVPDHSYRRHAFKVSDFVTPTSQVILRFVAEDANAGSLIEASLDDLEIWDVIPVGIDEISSISAMNAFPNPSKGDIHLMYSLSKAENLQLEMTNCLGQVVMSRDLSKVSDGDHKEIISTNSIEAGIYMLSLKTNSGVKSIRITVVK